MSSIPKYFNCIGRNLNYTRTFLTRDCIRVNIPTIPYEAFDNTGSKLKPWSILSLVESVRAFTFWKDENNTSVTEPYQSYLDLHEVLKNHFVFIIGVRLDINPVFNDFYSPKFPLFVDQKLKYLGKSSKTLTCDLYHAETKELYVSCDVTDVIVSTNERKPSPYPDWWIEKYGDLSTNEKARHIQVPMPNDDPLTSSVQVKYGDIDQYRHTNWRSYFKYSYESVSDYVMSKSFKRVNQAKLDTGLRKCDLVYSSESYLGDNLTIKSWESDTGGSTVVANNILVNGKMCCHCSLEFDS